MEYKKDSRVKNLLDNIEFVMVPIVNPDGIVVCVCACVLVVSSAIVCCLLYT